MIYFIGTIHALFQIQHILKLLIQWFPPLHWIFSSIYQRTKCNL